MSGVDRFKFHLLKNFNHAFHVQNDYKSCTGATFILELFSFWNQWILIKKNDVIFWPSCGQNTAWVSSSFETKIDLSRLKMIWARFEAYCIKAWFRIISTPFETHAVNMLQLAQKTFVSWAISKLSWFILAAIFSPPSNFLLFMAIHY